MRRRTCPVVNSIENPIFFFFSKAHKISQTQMKTLKQKLSMFLNAQICVYKSLDDFRSYLVLDEIQEPKD